MWRCERGRWERVCLVEGRGRGRGYEVVWNREIMFRW